jgi:IMP dehydrogenase
MNAIPAQVAGVDEIAMVVPPMADGSVNPFTLAAAAEAPGRGYHWGMATGHPTLPRGTRIKVQELGALEEILIGPAVNRSDGSLNLAGALREAMGVLGCKTLADLQKANMVICPNFLTEGKSFQINQGVGMGR